MFEVEPNSFPEAKRNVIGRIDTISPMLENEIGLSSNVCDERNKKRGRK
jgi:hypothetical protein